MPTTSSLLPCLTSRWAGPHAIKNMNAVAQYRITAPLLDDGVTSVVVTFADDVSAVVGEHAFPDLVITLTGADFALLAADTLRLPLALRSQKVQLKANSQRGKLLTKRLWESWASRPESFVTAPPGVDAPSVETTTSDAPAADATTSDAPATTSDTLDTSAMTKTELYDACVARGLEVSTTMLKAEIKAILDAHLAANPG